MKKSLLSISIALFAGISVMAQSNPPVQISVDAREKIATVSPLFNGSNIEDLNNQTNGGIFSQLIHGEAFEENVDVDFLNLKRGDYSKIYVYIDDCRRG